MDGGLIYGKSRGDGGHNEARSMTTFYFSELAKYIKEQEDGVVDPAGTRSMARHKYIRATDDNEQQKKMAHQVAGCVGGPKSRGGGNPNFKPMMSREDRIKFGKLYMEWTGKPKTASFIAKYKGDLPSTTTKHNLNDWMRLAQGKKEKKRERSQ